MRSVRPLRESELAEARRIAAISYLSQHDAAATATAMVYEDHRGLWGAFDDKGRMLAVHRLSEHSLLLDGQPVAVGSIGVFSALPEQRDSAGRDLLIHESLREMRSKGGVLSWIFPFSYEFYRRFGFELGGQTVTTDRLPLTHLMVEPTLGRGVWRFEADEDPEPLRACYRRFIADKNLALVREPALWDRLLRREPLTPPMRVYAVRDTRGTVTGYARMTYNDSEEMKTARVTELVYDDREAMLALLSQLRALSDEFEYLILPVVPGMPLAALIATPYHAYHKLEPCGMGRLVDVPGALLAMRAPQSAGHAVLATADVILPENNGPFIVSWDGGRVISVERTDRTPDLFAPINRLMQLIVGFISMREALLLPGISMISENPGPLELFTRREGMLLDVF